MLVLLEFSADLCGLLSTLSRFACLCTAMAVAILSICCPYVFVVLVLLFLAAGLVGGSTFCRDSKDADVRIV